MARAGSPPSPRPSVHHERGCGPHKQGGSGWLTQDSPLIMCFRLQCHSPGCGVSASKLRLCMERSKCLSPPRDWLLQRVRVKRAAGASASAGPHPYFDRPHHWCLRCTSCKLGLCKLMQLANGFCLLIGVTVALQALDGTDGDASASGHPPTSPAE